MTLLKRVFRRRRSSKGTSLLEAAIITPLLLVVTFSIIDFGALFYVYLALENGVSQATRYAVTGNVVGGQTRTQSIMTAMRQATPTLTLDDSAFTFEHMVPGGAGFLPGTGAPSDIERVTVSYNWNVMTPFMKPFFSNGQIVFRVASAMRNEP